MRICSRTRSISVIASVTGCSTCKAGVHLDEEELAVLDTGTRWCRRRGPGAQLADRLSRTISPMRSRVKRRVDEPGRASSISFWWRRCERAVALAGGGETEPNRSAITCTSMAVASVSVALQVRRASSPNAALASERGGGRRCRLAPRGCGPFLSCRAMRRRRPRALDQHRKANPLGASIASSSDCGCCRQSRDPTGMLQTVFSPPLWRRSRSYIMQDRSGLGPMKVVAVRLDDLGLRAFSDRKPRASRDGSPSRRLADLARGDDLRDVEIAFRRRGGRADTGRLSSASRACMAPGVGHLGMHR